MAYLLIDGYNLIGTAHHDLEAARNDLVEKLCRYSGLRGHDITVVFDGWKNGLPVENSHRIGRTTVIYSKLG
ncbi:MAG TPA: NYN domain-containing protein, partial [Nitrospirae bacterium]|nr:NYN domain-containing protein [Nitrospirota bacterium]